jgi:hypothetical protein
VTNGSHSPANRATLLLLFDRSHKFVGDELIKSVEVLVRLRMNLQEFKGKNAGKRSELRSDFAWFYFLSA